MSKIFLREKVYVPVDYIDTDHVEQTFTKMFYNESACRKCDNLPERHSLVCDTCPAFHGTTKTYSYKHIKGNQYIGIPSGQRHLLTKKFGVALNEFKIIDLRRSPKFDVPIEFTGKLRPYQVDAAKGWWKTKYGQIEAPPRSGKTITALAIGVELGLRFALLANQYEFLTQFIEHVEEFTNLPQLEKRYKRKLFGFPKTEKDFDTMQIMCCTYQQFISEKNGKTKFGWLTKNVGTVLVDETHKGGASEFSRILNNIPCKYKAGFTATTVRKDGKHVIVNDVVGPVRHVVSRETLVPKVTVHYTTAKPRSQYRGPAGWSHAMRFLATHEKRNDQIVEMAIKDLKKGRSIVIPVVLKDHVFELVRRINDAWPNGKIADYFVGGAGKQGKAKRNKVIADARSGKIRCVVGIRSLLQLGLNVVRWDSLYYVSPMSNKPNWKQESSRILTPDDEGVGKGEPLIRMFVEPDMGISTGCFTNTWIQCLQFGYKPTEQARERATQLLSKRKQRDADIFEDTPVRRKSGPSLFSNLKRKV